MGSSAHSATFIITETGKDAELVQAVRLCKHLTKFDHVSPVEMVAIILPYM